MHSEYQQMYTIMETAHTYGGPCKCQTAQPLVFEVFGTSQDNRTNNRQSTSS